MPYIPLTANYICSEKHFDKWHTVGNDHAKYWQFLANKFTFCFNVTLMFLYL